MTNNPNREKIVHPNGVWRYKTAEDKLLEILWEKEHGKTHSNCCDALMVDNGQTCSECKEPCTNQVGE